MTARPSYEHAPGGGVPADVLDTLRRTLGALTLVLVHRAGDRDGQHGVYTQTCSDPEIERADLAVVMRALADAYDADEEAGRPRVCGCGWPLTKEGTHHHTDQADPKLS